MRKLAIARVHPVSGGKACELTLVHQI